MPSDLVGFKKSPVEQTVIEPPSAKLIVRLFLIPLLIVAAAVGVMFLIGLLAGREPSFDEAIARLRLEDDATAAPDLVVDTFNGLVAFVVPGPDAYSVAQGESTTEPGTHWNHRGESARSCAVGPLLPARTRQLTR